MDTLSRSSRAWLVFSVAMMAMGFEAQAQTAPTDLKKSAVLPISISVDEKAVVRPFSNKFFGLNFEWGSSQDRVQIDPLTKEEDLQLAELCKGLPLPLNRMAGTLSQEFFWKQAIGPVDERAPQKLVPWESARKVRVGPVEWFSWVQKIDPRAEYVWTINILKETPQDAADLVQFLTGDAKAKVEGGKVNWAQKRVELGLPNPVKVTYWELGNELNLKANQYKDYVWTPEQYIERVKPFITAIRAANPKAKIIAAGSSYRDDWDSKLLKGLSGQIDYIAPHYYYRSIVRGADESGLKPGAFQGLDLSFITEWTDDLVKQIKAAATPDGRMTKILMTEHGMWPLVLKDKEWKSTWYQTHSLDSILSTSYFLLHYLAIPEVEATNYHNFSSGPWGLVYRDNTTQKLYRTGMMEMFRMLGSISDGELVASEVFTQDGETRKNAGSLLGLAAIKQAKGMTLILVNLGAERPINFSTKGAYRLKEAVGIWGNDLDAHSTAEKTVITIQPLDLGPKGKPLGRFSLPAQSLVVVKLDVEP